MRILSILLLSVTHLVLAQRPGADQKIQTETHFRTTTGQRLELDLATAANVTLTGWDKEEVVVQVDLEGQYLEVTSRQEEGVVYVRSRYTQTTDAAFSRGTIQIKVPYQLSVKGELTRGDVTLRELRGQTQLTTGPGFLTGYDLQGELHLEARNGQVELLGGHIEGTVYAQQGSVKVSDLRGKFTAGAGAGQFSVNSFSQPVHGQIGLARLQLTVSEGDVDARAFRSTMDVTWQGDPEKARHNLSLSGTNSRMTLYLPETLGLDAELDQVSTDDKDKPAAGPGDGTQPVAVSSLESDFALGTLPAAKTFTHQGKAHKLVQVRKKINNGGNKLHIRATDSQVKLKKLKQNAQ